MNRDFYQIIKDELQMEMDLVVYKEMNIYRLFGIGNNLTEDQDIKIIKDYSTLILLANSKNEIDYLYNKALNKIHVLVY